MAKEPKAKPPRSKWASNSPASPYDSPEKAVAAWLIAGQSLDAIHDALRQLYPQANPEKITAAVAASFALIARQPPEAVRGWCIAAARDLYRQMQTVGDYSGALKAVQVIEKLARAPDPGQSSAIDL